MTTSDFYLYKFATEPRQLSPRELHISQFVAAQLAGDPAAPIDRIVERAAQAADAVLVEQYKDRDNFDPFS